MSNVEERIAPSGGHTGRGWGGSRKGSGRKPKGIFSPLRGDLDYARNLVSFYMRDETQPAALRARCALAVLMRGTMVTERRQSGQENPPADPRQDGATTLDPGKEPDATPELFIRPDTLSTTPLRLVDESSQRGETPEAGPPCGAA